MGVINVLVGIGGFVAWALFLGERSYPHRLRRLAARMGLLMAFYWLCAGSAALIGAVA